MKNLYLLFFFILPLSPLLAQDEFTVKLFGDGIGFTDGYDAIETPDGGYLVIGSKGYQDLSNSQNPWVIKTDENANISWEYELDFGGSGFYDLALTGTATEGGYLILGLFADTLTFSDFSSLIKLDVNGNLLWSLALNGGEVTSFSGIADVGGGDFVIGGMRQVLGKNRPSMMKFDGNGQILWEKVYESVGLSAGLPFTGDLIVATDGSLLLTMDALGDAVLLKTDAAGNLLWNNSFATDSDGMSVRVLPDGQILVLTTLFADGSTPGFNFDYLVLLNPDGSVVQETLFDDQTIEGCNDMTVDAQGNVYIAGNNYAEKEAVIMKTDRFGTVEWTKTFPPKAPIVGLYFRSIHLTSDNHLIVAGGGFIPVGNFTTPGYLLFGKLQLEADSVSSIDPIAGLGGGFSVFPTPASNQVQFVGENGLDGASTLLLYGQGGQVLRKEKFVGTSFDLQRNGLPTGIYSYRIFSGKGKLVGSGRLLFE